MIIDAFCGCGGFALGAVQAGLTPDVSIDVDSILTSSFKKNFSSGKLLLGDFGKMAATDILEQTNGQSVDGIFGGPPCQGFSAIGRRDVSDPRRTLVGHFFRMVHELKPAFFVFENVRGLLFPGNLKLLQECIGQLKDDYEIFGPIVLDASEFGAATKRLRVFVIGTARAKADPFIMSDLAPFRKKATTVSEALFDLKDAIRCGDENGYDMWKLAGAKPKSEYSKLMTASNRMFTGHTKTKHTANVVSRFENTAPGEIDKIGKHPRLAWEGQCPTLRAGTGSDRGSYQSVRPIHPSEPRVITVREGARLQGFPDSFLFHPTIWHSYRMIGNSVSPFVSRAIFSSLKSKFEHRVLKVA